jgi:hypothetical protein
MTPQAWFDLLNGLPALFALVVGWLSRSRQSLLVNTVLIVIPISAVVKLVVHGGELRSGQSDGAKVFGFIIALLLAAALGFGLKKVLSRKVHDDLQGQQIPQVASNLDLYSPELKVLHQTSSASSDVPKIYPMTAQSYKESFPPFSVDPSLFPKQDNNSNPSFGIIAGFGSFALVLGLMIMLPSMQARDGHLLDEAHATAKGKLGVSTKRIVVYSPSTPSCWLGCTALLWVWQRLDRDKPYPIDVKTNLEPRLGRFSLMRVEYGEVVVARDYAARINCIRREVALLSIKDSHDPDLMHLLAQEMDEMPPRDLAEQSRNIGLFELAC